ncbi:DNA methylase [Streptomyces cinereus]|nr:DNA methylase [Streptomyces cinereus]
MNHAVHNKLVAFIWSIADDCLRDVYVRGKYRDVILPMTVLRRLDSILEPTKQAVLDEVAFQKEEGFHEPDIDGLCDASGYVFYNASKWTLKTLRESTSNNQQLLLSNFEEYLNGYSDNVKDILVRFKLLEQIKHMANKNVLHDVLEKFVSPYLNLSPIDQYDPQGNLLPALTNLGMGYVFEELIRRFNEENNEEAGEHFTPREVIELMTHLVFDPIKDNLPKTLTVYDPACGSGGMLTESQNFIHEKYPLADTQRTIELYGKEINDETYAICKSDMMIKGDNPENIRVGSTLSTNEFAGTHFDFMLSNPPYGKSWAGEKKNIYGNDGKTVVDERFIVTLKDYWNAPQVVDATPRSSDGQLLFLMEMVSKMKSASDTSVGSRIASVHNGSSLFTGDAGSGESNIRRHIIENDWLDAIIQLPNNLFYNTGITTYIWLLSNNKPSNRKGKVQLIDASQMYRKLKKNLGSKNCEFSLQDIATIIKTYLEMDTIKGQLNDKGEPTGIASQVFDNHDFGYYKINIERPDRRHAQFSDELIAKLRFDNGLLDSMSELYSKYGNEVYQKDFYSKNKDELKKWVESDELGLNPAQRKKVLDVDVWNNQLAILNHAKTLQQAIGSELYTDYNAFVKRVDETLKASNTKLKATERKQILDAVSWYDETGEKVIKSNSVFKADKIQELCERFGCEKSQLADFGYYLAKDVGVTDAKADQYVVYETSSELRDSESIPLGQSIYEYFLAEVRPHVNEAWLDMDSVKIGYEISFNKYFYQHKPLRSLEEVAGELLQLDKEADGLIRDILRI